MDEIWDFLMLLFLNEGISLQTKEEVWQFLESYIIMKKVINNGSKET
jgi:hypothetical protein